MTAQEDKDRADRELAEAAVRAFKEHFGIDPDLPDPAPDDVWWTYTCSICGGAFTVEEVRDHTEVERAKPDWPGHMGWTRTDLL